MSHGIIKNNFRFFIILWSHASRELLCSARMSQYDEYPETPSLVRSGLSGVHGWWFSWHVQE